MDDRFDQDERRFLAYRKKHPTATRAQFHMKAVAEQLRQGAQHHSLGTNLTSSGGFWQAGADKAKRYRSLADITPASRVVDYGCGSLRIGKHFIRFLDPGNFIGLDVTDEFYEIGRTEIGEELLRDKSPRFGVIGEDEIARTATFGADLVYSNAVCYQVHPEEQGAYFGSLARLAGKPGSRLIFNCMLADAPVRYSHRSWAWPIDTYKTALQDLDFVTMVQSRDVQKGENVIRPAVLKFQRAGATQPGWFSRIRLPFSRK